MSVTFGIAGIHPDYDNGTDLDLEINVSNGNAVDILTTLGIDTKDLYGEMRAIHFRNKCSIALKNLQRTGDPEIQSFTDVGDKGAKVIYSGRPEGYLASRIDSLLKLTEKAGDIGVIFWG